MASDVMLLPEPDSPTMPMHSPAAKSKPMPIDDAQGAAGRPELDRRSRTLRSGGSSRALSGSRTSRTASPIMLKASTVIVIATPAPMIGQAEPYMLLRPSRMMLPQLG